jgi:predicted transcriptional regulator
MDTVFIVNIVVSLIVGILGGLIGHWSTIRFQLVLEQRQQAMEVVLNDRINQIAKIVTRQDKVNAVETRWAQKKTRDETLVKELTELPLAKPAPHPWDPRLWGKG